MISFLEELPPVQQALLAGLFTWGLTMLGATVVFAQRNISRRSLDAALGFTAGVMLAASFWSLLAPSIAMSQEMGYIPWIPPLIGFLLGGLFLRLADYFLPHLHLFAPTDQAEGIPTSWRRSRLPRVRSEATRCREVSGWRFPIAPACIECCAAMVTYSTLARPRRCTRASTPTFR